MTTLVGTFALPDGTPERGTVHIALPAAAVLRDSPPETLTPGGISVDLDEHGAFTVDLVASDDPLWASEDPVPYVVRVRLSGLRSEWSVIVPTSASEADLADLVVLDGPPNVVAIPGPAPVITVDPDDVTATAVAHGQPPTAEITITPGDPGEYALAAEFGLVTGADGATAYELAVAQGFPGTEAEWLASLRADDPAITVSATPVAPGGTPTATVTGTYPALHIELGSVTGATGDTGPPGATVGVLTTKGDMLVRDAGAGTRLPVGAAGELLVADPAASTVARWGVLLMRPRAFNAGEYLIPGDSYSTFAPGSNTYNGSPLRLAAAATVDALTIEVAANTSGSDRQLRLGIYRLASAGWTLVWNDSAATTIAAGQTGLVTVLTGAPVALPPGIYVPTARFSNIWSGVTVRSVATNHLASAASSRPAFDATTAKAPGFGILSTSAAWGASVNPIPWGPSSTPCAVGMRIAA